MRRSVILLLPKFQGITGFLPLQTGGGLTKKLEQTIQVCMIKLASSTHKESKFGENALTPWVLWGPAGGCSLASELLKVLFGSHF